MPDSDYVRVKQTDTDWELTIRRSQLAAFPGAYEEIDKPATDSGNTPLPPKPKSTVSAEAAKKKTAVRQAAPDGHEAETQKES